MLFSTGTSPRAWETGDTAMGVGRSPELNSSNAEEGLAWQFPVSKQCLGLSNLGRRTRREDRRPRRKRPWEEAQEPQ